jgi:hypothetical protein
MAVAPRGRRRKRPPARLQEYELRAGLLAKASPRPDLGNRDVIPASTTGGPGSSRFLPPESLELPRCQAQLQRSSS